MDELASDLAESQARRTAVSPYAGRMAELARALRSERTSLATLQHVVQATAELVACDDVAVTVARSDGTVQTRASYGAGLAEQADQLQAHLREGPVVDRAWDAPVIRADDLPHDGSWPRWASAVVDQVGVRSLVCVQLFTHEDHELGALQLFSRRAHAFDDVAVDEAFGIAAQAAVALSAVQNHEALQFGLVRRTMIGQATGILMERYRLDANQAFEVLRRVSQEKNRKVIDLALDLIDGQQLPGV